jgi:peptidoglycan/xylan/chitin deacetylase (PgdA/CDA1 family)
MNRSAFITLICIFLAWPGQSRAQEELPRASAAARPVETRSSAREPRPADVLKYAPSPFELKYPPPLPPATPRVIQNGSRQDRRIALTFDACATRLPSSYDEAIIRVLVESRTPATLFLGGKWMAEHPEATRRLANLAQFELGNHSFLHPHLPRLPDDRVTEELRWTQVVMQSLAGRQAWLYRAPYLDLDERVVRLSAEMGLTAVQGDVASGDPDPGIDGGRLFGSVVGRARNGSIIIMHMNGRGYHTAEALPDIIAELQGRGFQLVTVGELIRGLP